MFRHSFLLFIAVVFLLNSGVVSASAGSIENMAHRGAAGIAPENTMVAFKTAVTRCGAGWVELDVHISKDGVPVIIHDDSLVRTTNAEEVYPDRSPWRVCDFTFAELSRLDAGKWFVEKDPFKSIAGGEVPAEDKEYFASGKVKIPALRGVLTLMKSLNCKVNIEVKNYPVYYPGIAKKVISDIKSLGMEKDVLISSFDLEILAEISKISPEFRLAALIEQPVVLTSQYFKDTLKVSAWNPGSDILGQSSKEYIYNGKLRTDLIAKAKEIGLDTYVWTVDEPEIMKEFIKAGVSGIITNFPHRLTAVLGKSK
ncbi:MAG: hypothetical protein HQM10_04110 [Candidatus Riflebacteria bacterium]|nr:hypothetical protein [Candidatus Riflebacteria bacterium]